MSLADLGKLRDEYLEKSDVPKVPAVGPTISRSLAPSQSRDDLRSIDEWRKPHRRERDDHQNMGHRQVDALLSYRNVVAQSVPRKPPSLTSYDGKQMHRDDAHQILTKSTRSIKTTRSGTRSMQNVPYTPGPEFPGLSKSRPPMPRVLHLSCARSEGGLDGNDDASHCNVMPRAHTDDTKDGATTISSGHSSPETEQFETLKEQRNSYRDMCLTLGAENAKLRNLLASKTCAPLYHPSHAQETMPSFVYHNNQQWPSHNSFPDQFTTQAVAMSDAGIHSHHELAVRPKTYRGQRSEGVHCQSFSTTSTDQLVDPSATSEDDTGLYPRVVAIGVSHNRIPWQARGESVQSFGRRTSGGGTTYAESDISLEHNIGQDSQPRPSFGPSNGFHQDSFFGGIESRLSMDITRYMKSLKSQLKKTEDRRLRVVEAITKTVKVNASDYFLFPPRAHVNSKLLFTRSVSTC